MEPCVFCGRITDVADKICSLCQQRMKMKAGTDIKSKPGKLDYWKERADELALRNKKAQVVIDYGNDHYQVWSRESVSKDCNIAYETGGTECA